MNFTQVRPKATETRTAIKIEAGIERELEMNVTQKETEYDVRRKEKQWKKSEGKNHAEKGLYKQFRMIASPCK